MNTHNHPAHNSDNKISVLFGCLGNICRSPTAHGVFQLLVNNAGLSSSFNIDSCGTGDWHIGQSPDNRSAATALARGYDLSALRARQICADDFDRFEYIYAMDNANLVDIQDLCPASFNGQIELFLPVANNLVVSEVPDPYYGGVNGFDNVIDLVESASIALLNKLKNSVEIKP